MLQLSGSMVDLRAKTKAIVPRGGEAPRPVFFGMLLTDAFAVRSACSGSLYTARCNGTVCRSMQEARYTPDTVRDRVESVRKWNEHCNASEQLASGVVDSLLTDRVRHTVKYNALSQDGAALCVNTLWRRILEVSELVENAPRTERGSVNRTLDDELQAADTELTAMMDLVGMLLSRFETEHVL